MASFNSVGWVAVMLPNVVRSTVEKYPKIFRAALV